MVIGSDRAIICCSGPPKYDSLIEKLPALTFWPTPLTREISSKTPLCNAHASGRPTVMALAFSKLPFVKTFNCAEHALTVQLTFLYGMVHVSPVFASTTAHPLESSQGLSVFSPSSKHVQILLNALYSVQYHWHPTLSTEQSLESSVLARNADVLLSSSANFWHVL